MFWEIYDTLGGMVIDRCPTAERALDMLAYYEARGYCRGYTCTYAIRSVFI